VSAEPQRRFGLPAGALWMSYSYLVGFGLQAVYFVILARVLGADEYGLFVGGLALVTTFASVAGLGGGNVLVMETARDGTAYRRQLGTALAYIALSFIPLAAIVVAIVLLITPILAWVVLPLLVSELVFTSIYDVGLQSFQSHENLSGVAHFNVGASAGRVVVVTAFAALGLNGAAGWAWCYAAVSILTAVILLIVCMRVFGTPLLNRASLRRSWRVGAFFSLGMSSRIILNDSDKFVLVSNGYESQGGQYGASHRLVNMAFAPLQAITYSLNTELFRAGKDGYRAAWRVLRRVLPIAGGYVVVAALLLWLLSPLAVAILGDDYSLMTQMLPLLALTLFGQMGYYFFGDALMGLGRQGVRSVSQAVVGVGVLVSNVLLVPVFGWVASAMIAIIASLVLALLLVTLFLVGLWRERRAAKAMPDDSCT